MGNFTAARFAAWGFDATGYLAFESTQDTATYCDERAAARKLPKGGYEPAKVLPVMPHPVMPHSNKGASSIHSSN